MKKSIAVILSVIILVLSAVSCSDMDDFAGQQNQTVMLTVEQSSGSVLDICNPFFFCHTGHNAFVQSEKFVMEFIFSPVRLPTENSVFDAIPVYTPIWNPPKG